jgi:hypothetical protein
MAKRRPTEAEGLIAAASKQNPASRGLTLDRPGYEELRDLFQAFVFSRSRGEHRCGMPWFIDHGISLVNAARKKQRKPPLPTDVTGTTLMAYARRNWPEQVQAFRR